MTTASKNLTTLAALLIASALSAQGATYRLSASSTGVPGNHSSDQAAVSADGRYVAFASRSDNLVPGDRNNSKDIFVKELISGKTTRVSVATGGGESNGDSASPSVSADGRYVAFVSAASNLVSGDRNGYGDVFVHDRQTRKTVRVSVTSGGGEGNHASMAPAISGDGRYVAFQSMASNLVSGDTNGQGDIFVHDRGTAKTIRASVAWNTGQPSSHCYSPDISDDGRYVVFASRAPNLVSGDKNNKQDIFLRDTRNNTITRLSKGFGSESDGDSYQPRIDSAGNNVCYHSDATNLIPADYNKVTDVFVWQRASGKTLCASLTVNFKSVSGPSRNASISDDGRYVAFESTARDLTAKSSFATDIFVKDMTTWKVQLCSLTSDGYVAQDHNYGAAISGDGRYVAFHSMDDGLVPNDTNAQSDIILHEVSPHLSTQDLARIGRTIRLTLESPRDAGQQYLALAATNNQFGIALGGRLFPLDNDWLLSISMVTPSVFVGFGGRLDQNGKGNAQVVLPAVAALLNFEFLVAYTTIDPNFPTGFRGFSNALPFIVGR